MIKIEKQLIRGDIYPVEKLSEGHTPVLFDIETTGLGAASACIYLIGALKLEDDVLSFRQWFAESPYDEVELIKAFFDFLPDAPCLISFNGRGFDVPFICKRCKQHDIPCTLPQLPNIDLYRRLAPLKDFFGMNSRRLVAYEALIGLEREDKYNGGELIEVYKQYIGKKKFAPDEANELRSLLLLHNEEDITDMVPVLGLLSYIDLIEGEFRSYTVSDSPGQVKLSLIMDSDFPVSKSKLIATVPTLAPISLECFGRNAVFTIPKLNGRLRHFFDDYKNYYYLPVEDTAMHKSVASGVDPAHRQQATRATAYINAEGGFIPQGNELLKPDFKKEYGDRQSFILPKSLRDHAAVRNYIKGLF